MPKQEFLKTAVSNMDRDVEYEYSNSGHDKEANKSDVVKETGPTNFSDGDSPPLIIRLFCIFLPYITNIKFNCFYILFDKS